MPWLRVLGASVGRGAEVSTAAHLDPDLLTLGEGASSPTWPASAPRPSATAGCFRPTTVGDRAFVGNAALYPGHRLGPDSLVGVATVPPPARIAPARPGSAPRHASAGAVRTAAICREDLRPSRWRVPNAWPSSSSGSPAGLALGIARVPLPAVLGAGGGGQRPAATALRAPVLAIMSRACWWSSRSPRPNGGRRHVPASGRAVVDRFVRRSEFVTGLYEAAAVPTLLDMLVGTPFRRCLRLFGPALGGGPGSQPPTSPNSTSSRSATTPRSAGGLAADAPVRGPGR